MDPMTMYLISQGISTGLNALFGGGGSGQQERASFEQTGADPTDWLSDARSSLSQVLQGAAARANEPVDLSGSNPIAPGRFKTGFPPSSVGGFSAGTPAGQPNPNGGPSRVPFSGFNLNPSTLGNDARKIMPEGTAVRRKQGQISTPKNPLGAHAAISHLPPSQPTDGGTSTTQNPQAIASAKLLLHSLLSQPTSGQPGQGA